MKKLILATFTLLTLHAKCQTAFKTLQPVEMQNELAIVSAAFDTLHPGTYRYNSRQQMDIYFDNTLKRVAKPLSEDRYDILLAQLTAKIKCGHTYLNYWNQDKTLKASLYSKA